MLSTLFIRSTLNRMELQNNRSRQRRPRMRIHRNAKTTPAARAALVHRVLHEDWTYAETATAFAVSERTVAKWVHRFRVGGVAARAGRTPDASTGGHSDPAAARGPGVARVGHCPHAGPAALDGERLAATAGHQPPADPPAGARAPVRVAPARRPAPRRHQATGLNSRRRASDPWGPPTDLAGRRLGVRPCRDR